MPTCAIAVGIFDRSLDKALTDGGVGKGEVLGEPATPDGKGTGQHSEDLKGNNESSCS